MTEKSGSKKKSGGIRRNPDKGGEERSIAGQKNRVDAPENELKLKREGAISEDVDGCKRAEQERDRVFEYSLDMLCVVGFDGTYKRVSRSFTSILGWSEQELLGKHFTEFIHPDDREASGSKFREHESGAEAVEFENRYLCKDGPCKWVSWNAHPVVSEEIIIGVGRDITERKRMEEELRWSRDELRAAHQSLIEKSRYLDAFFNHTITPLVLLDRDFNFIRVNEAYAKACQKEVDEFPGHNHFEYYPSDARAIFEDVIRTRQPVQVIARPFVFPDHPDWGETYWDWTLTPLLDRRGEVEALVFALEDVTERKRAEIELEKHRDQLQELVRERTCDLENATERLRNEITERKRTEKALRESEERFSAFMDNNPAIAWMKDEQGVYVFLNKACGERIGIGLDDWLWKTDLELFPCDVADRLRENDREVMASGRMISVEEETVSPDGHRIQWLSVKFPFKDALGNRYVGGIAIDISERKRAEEALRESEERFKAIFDRAAVGIAISNSDSFMVDSNQTFQEMLGYSKEELRQRRFYDITHPEDIDYNRGLHDQLVAGAIDKYQIEKRYIRKDGRNIWVKLTASAIRDADGEFKYNLAAFEDITERKRAEEALKSSEAKFRALFEGAGMAIFVADVATGKIIDCNRKAEELTGRPRDEIIGLHQTQLHPADQAEAQMEQFARHVKGIILKNDEAEVQHRDGRVIPVMINAALLKVNGRDILIGFFLDITERKRAEEALRESEKKFRVLADTSKAAIYVYKDEKLVYVNDAAEKITGYSKAELLKMRFWDIVRPDLRELVRERGLARQRGEPVPSPYEVPFITKGGEARWIELSAGPITFMGRPAAVATFFDITERKRAEEELKAAKAQAELYLDLMGHDINNLHQIALGYLELALSMPADARPDEMLEKPIEVLQRSAQLIKNVRKLQKLKEGVFQGQEIDVCNVLIDVQREMGAVPHKAIVLNMNGCECCHVRANELLHDVFANLVSNAIKHTGARADIVVDLDVIKDNGCRSCRVSVEDNGPGIPDDFKGKVFNRMLKGTDKAKGIGLGLYLVKSLVESYGGRVWVEDRVPGDHTKGARFVVMLPAVEK